MGRLPPDPGARGHRDRAALPDPRAQPGAAAGRPAGGARPRHREPVRLRRRSGHGRGLPPGPQRRRRDRDRDAPPRHLLVQRGRRPRGLLDRRAHVVPGRRRVGARRARPRAGGPSRAPQGARPGRASSSRSRSTTRRRSRTSSGRFEREVAGEPLDVSRCSRGCCCPSRRATPTSCTTRCPASRSPRGSARALADAPDDEAAWRILARDRPVSSPRASASRRGRPLRDAAVRAVRPRRRGRRGGRGRADSTHARRPPAAPWQRWNRSHRRPGRDRVRTRRTTGSRRHRPPALHPVLDKVLARIQEDAAPDRRDALAAFAKAFLRRLSPEELERPATTTCRRSPPRCSRSRTRAAPRRGRARLHPDDRARRLRRPWAP